MLIKVERQSGQFALTINCLSTLTSDEQKTVTKLFCDEKRWSEKFQAISIIINITESVGNQEDIKEKI